MPVDPPRSAPTAAVPDDAALAQLPPSDSTLDTVENERSYLNGVRRDVQRVLDLRAHVRERTHEENAGATAIPDIDRRPTPSIEAHQEAIPERVAINPTVDTTTGGGLIPSDDTPPPQPTRQLTGTHELVPGGPTLLRDRVALLEIVRYRLLSFRQLQSQVFTNLHKTVLTRRMQALKQAGFIATWEERLTVGGHPRYALPTRTGLEWALQELTAETNGLPHTRLVRLMIGETGKRPLELAPRTAPPFLPHQEETNRVVAALEAQPDLGVTWASTWHRPFPNAIDDLRMPQPDGVLVATRDGKPHLVFLEHDRGQEAPASFARKKAERYYELSLYGIAQELFGFDDFTVWVTINDVANRKPLQRIRTLQAVSRNARMMRFTLAGWIPAHGHQRPIWFTPTTAVVTPEHRPDAHTSLTGAFAAPSDAALDDIAADTLRRARAGSA
ncbi:MAG TPA: replication-relaxation family protein [Thermoanaerobaculia bacterium]|nr:replication-relaxation family protein [Thermoanaerobaculia bacterium]